MLISHLVNYEIRYLSKVFLVGPCLTWAWGENKHLFLRPCHARESKYASHSLIFNY